MITRRGFLESTGAALAAMPIRSLGAAETADVVVIGAGLAGLTAGITLADEGAKVIVLEANSHVGGRTHTLETSHAKLDTGATTVGPYYARVRNLMKRLDIGQVLPGGRGDMTISVGGQLLHPNEWENSEFNKTRGAERKLAPWLLEARLLSPDNPLTNPFDWLEDRFDKYDVSLRQLLQSRGVSDEALRLIDVTINANDLDTSSALLYLRDLQRLTWSSTVKDFSKFATYTPTTDGSSAYIEGGTGVLPKAMAELLGDRVRVNQPVTGVTTAADGVSVQCRDGSYYRADHVICAAPLAVLKDIHWQPALSGSMSELVYGTQPTLVTHVFFAVEKPFWEADTGHPAMYSDSILERAFAPAKGPAGEVAFLDCWANGRSARQLDAVPLDQLGDFATKIYTDMRPAAKGKIRFLTSYSWGRNPYVRGNKHEYHPGQVKTVRAAIEQDTAPLYFAGEHFRIGEPGMEGAAESGERAALKVLGVL